MCVCLCVFVCKITEFNDFSLFITSFDVCNTQFGLIVNNKKTLHTAPLHQGGSEELDISPENQ